jgi:hypothetical protein
MSEALAENPRCLRVAVNVETDKLAGFLWLDLDGPPEDWITVLDETVDLDGDVRKVRPLTDSEPYRSLYRVELDGQVRHYVTEAD